MKQSTGSLGAGPALHLGPRAQPLDGCLHAIQRAKLLQCPEKEDTKGRLQNLSVKCPFTVFPRPRLPSVHDHPALPSSADGVYHLVLCAYHYAIVGTERNANGCDESNSHILPVISASYILPERTPYSHVTWHMEPFPNPATYRQSLETQVQPA